MQARDRTTVALIGAGGRHGRFHLDMILALEGELELVAICEKDRERLRAAAEAAGPSVRATRHARDLMVGDDRPDLAIVTLMTHTSPQMCQRFLDVGVPVLTEVPPAYVPAVARPLVATAERRGLAFGAFENYVVTPLELLKQQAIRDGVFGTVERADIAGCVGHKGHEIAIARSYVGWDAKPVRARADGYGTLAGHSVEGVDIPAVLRGVVEFDTGAEAHFHLSGWGPHGPFVPIGGVHSEFHASRGGYWNGSFHLGRADDPRSSVDLALETEVARIDGVDVIQEMTVGGDAPVRWRNPFADHAFPAAEQLPSFAHVEDTPRAWETACAVLFRNMARAIRGEEPLLYPVTRAMQDVRIRIAMLQSARRYGEWVEWRDEPFELEQEYLRFDLYWFLKRFDFRKPPRINREPARRRAR